MVTAPVRIGSYRIERLLGVGSFATVWLGHDESLGARVAIKVLAENWSHDLRVRERFLDEGRLLWQLDHRRVIRVHALGEMPDGRPYLVMAWADRGSLRDRLAAGPPTGRAAWSLLREICAGAAVLHANGIVHRDLTPGNVLFRSRADGPSERVLIADLGLAKSLAAASGLTARAGTPGYMAPEQDDPLAVVDRTADVYSLGRLGMRLLRDDASPAVAAVLKRATAVQPADRYRDAGDLLAALDRAAARGRRRRWITRAALLPVLAVTLVAPAADAVTGWHPTRPGRATDPSGRLSLGVPAGWRADAGRWGSGHSVLVAPDPGRWSADPAMPGTFAWITGPQPPRAFLAGRSHPGCAAAPVRGVRRSGVDWVVAAYTACPGGRTAVIEAAGLAPGATHLIYVQVAPPAGSGPAFADPLLAGVRVSSAPPP